MRDEDVVRMLVSGATAGEMIERIRSSETDFDLSEDMLDELRIAGVPEAVIQAMIVRQREQTVEPEEPEGPAPELVVTQNPRVILEIAVRFDDIVGERRKSVVRFPPKASQRLAEALELGPAEEDRAVTAAAYFAACTSAEHVPDHWRNKSPVGRDFIHMPRHRMLSFRPVYELVAMSSVEKALRFTGTTERPKKQKKRKKKGEPETPGGDEGKDVGHVKLDLSQNLEAELEPGVRHDLLFGIAAEIGGRYYLLAGAEMENVNLEAGKDLIYDVTVEPANRTGFGIEVTAARR
jgi:hypothetical protein